MTENDEMMEMRSVMRREKVYSEFMLIGGKSIVLPKKSKLHTFTLRLRLVVNFYFIKYSEGVAEALFRCRQLKEGLRSVVEGFNCVG